MRPIALTIKGINSFREEQTIDFVKLTNEGIFGIFGPTGSGKSTILDGITLALYGEIARKSKNFIHVGTDSASVSFTFSITEKETKTYRIFRSFKVKKDTGYSVAAKARLCELTGNAVSGDYDKPEKGAQNPGDCSNELVLEDTISGVKERIHKLIGLEFDDFTRTVVLPQGKFSEFLKLSGSDRNQMLERLFNLYDYGIALTDKVKRKSDEAQLQYTACLGKLAEHAGENKEALADLKCSLKQAQTALKEKTKEKEQIDEKYQNYRVIWELQEELSGYRQELSGLKERKAEIEHKKQELEAAEKALQVKPFDDQYRKQYEEYQSTKTQAAQCAEQFAEEKQRLDGIAEAFKEITQKKEAVESAYREKLPKLERAIEMQKQIAEVEQRVNELREKQREQAKKAEDMSARISKAQGELTAQKEQLSRKESAYFEHMKEAVLQHLYRRMEQEGVCPVCGAECRAHASGAMPGAKPGARLLTGAGTEYSPEIKEIEALKKKTAQQEAWLFDAGNEQMEIKASLASLEASLQSAEEIAAAQKEELCKLMSDCGITKQPQEYKKQLEKDYQSTCVAYEHLRQEAESCKEALKQREILCAREQTKEEEQQKKTEEAFALLKQKLEEYGFADESQMRDCSFTMEQRNQAKECIRAYEERYSQVSNQTALLEAKIGDRKVGQEDYESVSAARKELEEAIHSFREQAAVYSERMEKLKAALVIVADLEKEKERLEHQKALLSELTALLKGKKFVEYVARERLTYVAGEASEKLMEITGGIFGLELRENGEFAIRDYKNGGMERNVNSLSGGELFLVSLSLALALSTQIQLKGTAPLEFFFLDEGFGTLDDNLLDTVMDSLDQLHHDRCKIGIISHVEAIKERVPVKLIVTPAKAGENASRVEIVR